MDGNQHTNEPPRPKRPLRRAGWLLSGLVLVGVCVAVRWNWPAGPAAAQSPRGGVRQASAIDRSQPPSPPQAGSPGGAALAPRKNPVAALVNNDPISREDLAGECLLHYGNEVLESMLNRALIQVSCQSRNITITPQDVDAEIERMARKFQVGKDQWLQMLQKERGITPDRYANDIVWPTLALRELAKQKIQITRRELDEAYESEFGPGVKVRLIAMDDLEKARSIRTQAVQRRRTSRRWPRTIRKTPIARAHTV